MKIDLSVDVSPEPKAVIAALTDFSEKRPEIWTSLDKDVYEVHEVGDGYAVVTEGGPPKGIWARERYEWDDRTVRWTVEESSFCTPGSYVEATVSPGSAGGSHIDLHWERTPSNLKGAMAMVMMRLVGKRLLTKSIRGPFEGSSGS